MLSPEEGKAPPSMKELMAALAMAQDFLVKLPKLRPDDDNQEDTGIDAMRQLLEDPVLVVGRLIVNPKFIAALKGHGWLPPPAKLRGRPTKDEAIDREMYEIRQRETAEPDALGDDSELRRMLGTTQGPTQ